MEIICDTKGRRNMALKKETQSCHKAALGKNMVYLEESSPMSKESCNCGSAHAEMELKTEDRGGLMVSFCRLFQLSNDIATQKFFSCICECVHLARSSSAFYFTVIYVLYCAAVKKLEHFLNAS